MKKKIVAFIVLFVLAVSTMSVFVIQAAAPTVKVTNNADGTITISTSGDTDDQAWVGVYKKNETYNPDTG